MAAITTLSVTSLNRAAVAEAAARSTAPPAIRLAGNRRGRRRPGPRGRPRRRGRGRGHCPADPPRPSCSRPASWSPTPDGPWPASPIPDALAVGYAPQLRKPQAVKHYFNPAHVSDGRVLDPARPEELLYAFTTRGPVVVAAVYLMNRAGEPGRVIK